MNEGNAGQNEFKIQIVSFMILQGEADLLEGSKLRGKKLRFTYETTVWEAFVLEETRRGKRK